MGVSRSADNGGHRKPPPTADCRTLYIGGLSAGVRERDISDALPGSKVVRQPPGKNFAFVEFESHASAAGILERAATAVGVSVRNRPVTVGWANNEGPSSVSNRDNGERSALTTPPSSECRTLFIGGLPPAGGEDDDRIKSELLTMLKGSQEVHRISGKTFAFVEFDSHHSASAVVEAFSSGSFSFTVSSGGRRCDLIVGWSKGEGRGDAPSADCWFCLASPSVKVHLVVSVSNHMYLSLPRGGVTDFHVLAIPIECVNSRLKISPGAAVDLDRYQIALEKMFESLGMTSIRYERALRTRGRDHMQVHIVPIMKQHAHRAIPTFLQTASKYNLQFHEITGNVDLADVLSGSGGNALQGGPYEEYFYIELPISGSDEKRKFVFVKDRSFIRDKSAKFPMQFGSEVSAVAIDRPDRANWKNCALTEDQEKELCANFQSVFESFDFN